jgi:hypothetical protein
MSSGFMKAGETLAGREKTRSVFPACSVPVPVPVPAPAPVLSFLFAAMHSLIPALALGVLLGAAPDDSALRSCLDACEAGDADETDRGTCRLQCREAARSREEANFVEWKRVDELGGSPSGQYEGGSTITTTETGPSGTKTTTTRKPTHAPAPAKPTAVAPRSQLDPRHPPASHYASIASCQAACDPDRVDSSRATCKISCLANERARLRALRSTASAKSPAAAKTTATSGPAAIAACRSRCTERSDSCFAACKGTGANRAGCERQCDEHESSCRAGCK